MRNYALRARAERLRAEAAPRMAELERQSALEQVAGLVRIERGAAAFRVTFPHAQDRWRDTRPIIAEIKSIMGRRYDPFGKAWSVPVEAAGTIEALAAQYGAEIEELAVAAGFEPDAAARIAALEAELAQRDLYIAGLEAENAELRGVAA